MPEGPSIVILRQEAARFAGKRIMRVEGNTTIDKERLLNKRIVQLHSWGKHFLIETPTFSVRVHLLMFGSYRINERKDWATERLSLGFTRGEELNFYTCSVQFIDLPLDDIYDWRVDAMSDDWDPAYARQQLRSHPDMLVCDALQDQGIFAGVGNIIKNEVLFRIRLHPLSTIGALPPRKLQELVREARQYCFDFYEWKKQFVLKKHWLAHTKRTCPRCQIPLVKAHLGKTQRRSFFCEGCQVKYG
ncbi:MAG: DNA-formamidopyrimidine glycosylase family protein [Pseudomonadota bacterium]